MTIEAAIAHSIHTNFDIITVLPSVMLIPINKLEQFLEQYFQSLEEDIHDALSTPEAEHYLQAVDAAALCTLLLSNKKIRGRKIPDLMLLTICQTIARLYGEDIELMWGRDRGVSVYRGRIAIDCSDLSMQPFHLYFT